MGCPFSIVAELGTRTLEMESKALTASESAGLAILIEGLDASDIDQALIRGPLP
jgi:hypothetical protein